MKSPRLIVAATLGLIAFIGPILAHHSPSVDYDLSKMSTLRGTVTEVQWINPHVRLTMDVTSADGKTTNRWAVELGAGNKLQSVGRTRLKTGDVISVEGWLAKDGGFREHGVNLTLADGTTVPSGSEMWDKTAVDLFQAKQKK
jgi:hypothetical protein